MLLYNILDKLQHSHVRVGLKKSILCVVFVTLNSRRCCTTCWTSSSTHTCRWILLAAVIKRPFEALVVIKHFKEHFDKSVQAGNPLILTFHANARTGWSCGHHVHSRHHGHDDGEAHQVTLLTHSERVVPLLAASLPHFDTHTLMHRLVLWASRVPKTSWT